MALFVAKTAIAIAAMTEDVVTATTLQVGQTFADSVRHTTLRNGIPYVILAIAAGERRYATLSRHISPGHTSSRE